MISGDGKYMLKSVELIAFITGLTSHEEPVHTNNAALWLTNALEKLISVKMSDNINNRLDLLHKPRSLKLKITCVKVNFQSQLRSTSLLQTFKTTNRVGCMSDFTHQSGNCTCDQSDLVSASESCVHNYTESSSLHTNEWFARSKRTYLCEISIVDG